LILFEAKDLTKTYGKRTVLDLPYFSLDEGAVYCLQGPNGSGKTTLLEILSFLLPPTTGDIFYKGRKIDSNIVRLTDLRREIVLVPQNPVLFSRTVYGNVEVGLKIRGIQAEQRDVRIRECLDIVNMLDLANAHVRGLSGGEVQRTAIAMGLACSPKVIFFDEPTSNLDSMSRKAIERIIKSINELDGITVVFTTHDAEQAFRLAGSVIALHEGRLVNSAFGNIFNGLVTDDSVDRKICLVENMVRLRVDTPKAGPVSVCISPTDLRIVNDPGASAVENLLKGTITRISNEGEMVLITLDLGFPLNVALPQENIVLSTLCLGRELHVLCPSSSIQIL